MAGELTEEQQDDHAEYTAEIVHRLGTQARLCGCLEWRFGRWCPVCRGVGIILYERGRNGR